MQKPKFKFMFVIAAMFVVFCCPAAFAQETVSQEKQALIRELWEVVGGRKVASETLDSMVRQRREVPKPLLTLVDSDKSLTSLQRQELKQIMAENAEDINRRFLGVIKQRFDLGQLLEELTVPIYSKHFTESELRELIAFYRSPIGQKVAFVLPKLAGEVATEFEQKHGFEIRKFINETLQAEFTQMKQYLRRDTGKKAQNAINRSDRKSN